MIKIFKILPLLLLFIQFGYAQNKEIRKKIGIKVRVVDKGSNTSIKTAEVSVHGKMFRYNANKNYYYVEAYVGDELVVSNPGFVVVYHRIKSEEDIRIEVDGFKNTNRRKSKFKRVEKKENPISDIQVRIINKETNEPFKTAYIYANGKTFEYSHIKKYYQVKARIGDKLVVSYDGEETTSYTIESDKISISVEIVNNKPLSSVSREYFQYDSKRRKRNSDSESYFRNLDSAKFYKSKDVGKSLSFIENILKEDYSDRRNSATYRLLGDIYFEWEQYDLAISNYKNSLQYLNNDRTKLQASKAAIRSKKFDVAQGFLLTITTSKLGLFEKILTYESLGDIYLEKKEFPKSETNYNKALKIAEDNKISSKITDLNSKLGDVSAAQGKISIANSMFDNSLNLATQESPIRSLEEKEKVANFYNSTQQFDKEINLRKQTLLQTKQVNDSLLILQDADDKASLGSISGYLDENNLKLFGNLYKSINLQSINYKIGRALVQKEDYKEAIPFLKKSIEDAEKENDFSVKKDATRKLSEVYDNVGEYDKAFKTYKDYVALVDTLYIRKSQEIAQAKRLSKGFIDYENRIQFRKKQRLKQQ
ncbi:MAG: hypothetical protein JKY02_09385 [Flavobacteriaceae bacterium]|nr:hypothetical protein [Flavobacteriaceae bacterium]